MGEEVPTDSVLINYGTWDSLIHSFANVGQLRALRRANPSPRLRYAAARQGRYPKKSARGFKVDQRIPGTYALPFMGADASIVRRSQVFRQEEQDKTPIRFSVFFTLPSLYATCLFLLWGLLFNVLAKFSLGRSFLLKYPRIGSFNTVSFEGPTEATRAASLLSLNILLKAVHPESGEATEYHTRILLRDPGYDGTAACVVQSALTLLHDRASLPPGGVYTSAAAFANSGLLDRLAQHPITFSLLSKRACGFKENDEFF